MPRTLIACEFSGTVRNAFLALGHDAWSCDLLPTESPGPHIVGDVRDILGDGWDLMIVFPPCTYLCSSGMHWTVRGLRDPKLTEDALDFVRALLGAPIPRIALENPVGAISTRIRRPDFIAQPHEYGDPFSKKTCFWTKNLPQLIPTNILPKPASGRWENQCATGSQNRLGPSPDRWKLRSKTYPGLGKAMAAQWSSLCVDNPKPLGILENHDMRTKNPHAVALGKLGGSKSTPAKQQSARANGKKGGRPKNKASEHADSNDDARTDGTLLEQGGQAGR